MTHPLTPHILDLAIPIADSLGLELVTAVFYTNQSPPVLRLDIRNLSQDTSLDDCERMSRAVEASLDASELIPDAYVLEVSSPGISRSLTTDREFISFKGFPVCLMLTEAYKGHKSFSGNLIERDEECIHINQKGRAIAIPRHLVQTVQLSDAGTG